MRLPGLIFALQGASGAKCRTEELQQWAGAPGQSNQWTKRLKCEFPQERRDHQRQHNRRERQRAVAIANAMVHGCGVGAYISGRPVDGVELAGCALLLCRSPRRFSPNEPRSLYPEPGAHTQSQVAHAFPRHHGIFATESSKLTLKSLKRLPSRRRGHAKICESRFATASLCP